MKRKFKINNKAFCVAVTLAIVLFLLNIDVFAQYYEDAATGVSLVMSDDWSYSGKEKYGDSNINYRYKYGKNEIVGIDFYDISNSIDKRNMANYNTENLSDDFLFSLCEEDISDEAIARRLNSKAIYVTSESMITRRETIGAVVYYRVEKAFTLTEPGYYPFFGYITEYVTICDGSQVMVKYVRSNDNNHFSDVYAMLQTINVPSAAPPPISIVMNGNYIYPDAPPVMENDRVLVPIRAIAEKMGYGVDWNEIGPDVQIVTIKSSNGSNIVNMYIGDNSYTHNGNLQYMDVAPAVIGDYTYIPLRAAAEALGATVNWDDAAQTVYISY